MIVPSLWPFKNKICFCYILSLTNGSFYGNIESMEKNIFIASTERYSGKSLVTMGLINTFRGIVPEVGYMKPIGQRYRPGSTIDEDAALMKLVFNLGDELSDINPLSMNDAQRDKDTLFEKIFDAYNHLSKGKDIVVIEGTDYTSTLAALEFDINAHLAQNMSAPVLLVANGASRSVDNIIENLIEVTESVRGMGCKFLGAVINRFDSKRYLADLRKIEETLHSCDIHFFGAIQSNSILSGPRLRDVAEELGAEVVFKGDNMLKVVADTKILAMTPEHSLEYIKDQNGYLLIIPGDRMDNIFAVMSAQRSIAYPRYSGIVLTGGLIPEPNILNLLRGISDSSLTILSVKDDTYTTALKVDKITGELKSDDKEKIELACQLVEKYVDIDRIYSELGSVETNITTPQMFQYRILEKARTQTMHIVLPEGTEPRIIRAAGEALGRDICRLTLLGNIEKISEASKSLEVDISRACLLDPATVDKKIFNAYVNTMYQARKHKGCTREMAVDLTYNPICYAAIMVQRGDADGFVSGATHSTADTLGAVLKLISTADGVSLASSIFFMCMPDQVLVYGDCALVLNPNAEQLADIAITSSETARFFGIEPVVAMLSYSTGESGKGKDVDKVREATRIVRERKPELLIEGPIQYDAATSEEVARVKLKDSDVAGKATVYIFPDLDAGNTAYKAVQRSAKVPAIGPVLQGLRKPANDLSRGATVSDILYTIAITAIQAQKISQTGVM